MSKKSTNNECGPGKILRKGYRRKSYLRKKYFKNRKIIPTTYVSASYVPPTCIRDMGKPGKGPKTLPKPDEKIHLTKYGYSIYKPDRYRRAALRAAARDHGTLMVLRRLNLIRNFQAIPENKKIFSRDVEYLKNIYNKIRKKRKNIVQKGGNDNNDTNQSSDTSEIATDYIDLPKQEKNKITMFYSDKKCNDKNVCKIINRIYEKHRVDGKEIIFYTIDTNDVEGILELDKVYLDPRQTKENVISKIENNLYFIIAVKVNNKLQGYCQYEPLDDKTVRISWFCSNKGYRTALYVFMEKFFGLSGYDKIILDIDKNDMVSQELEFWHTMGFDEYEPREFKTIKNKIYLVKYLSKKVNK
jgi:hypothetical protein